MNLDSQQLELRRKGLERFLNTIQSHPVLFKDALVVDFLSTRIEIQDYKTQNDISFEESVTQEPFTHSLPLDMGNIFIRFEETLNVSIQQLQETVNSMNQFISDSNSQFKTWGGMARHIMYSISCIDYIEYIGL